MNTPETDSQFYIILFDGKARCQTPKCNWTGEDSIYLDINEPDSSQGIPPDVGLDEFFKQFLIYQCMAHHRDFGHNKENHNVFDLLLGEEVVGRIAASSATAAVAIYQDSYAFLKDNATIKPRDAME